MIEVQLKDIISSPEVLNEIAKKDLKARPAYKLARVMREIDREFSLFQENRKQLISKYADKDEKGNIKYNKDGNITVEKDKIDLFNNEIEELLNTSIQLNVDLIELNDIEDVNFTPQQMNILSLFIKE